MRFFSAFLPVLLLLGLQVQAQTNGFSANSTQSNPFAKIGMADETVVINGYDHIPQGDSIATIYGWGYNKYTGQVITVLAESDIDPTTQLFAGEKPYRWLSVDPVVHPYQSPYAAFEGNPILYIDNDGRKNVIYLVYLPTDKPELTKTEVMDIAKQATDNFATMGLKTKVVFVDMSTEYNKKNFNIAKLDKTDAVAVIGTDQDVKNYISPYLDPNSNYSKALCGDWQGDDAKNNWKANSEGPEISENESGSGGYFIAIAMDGVKGFAKDVIGGDVSPIQAGGLIVNHGAGHNAGEGHFAPPYFFISNINFDANRLARSGLTCENYNEFFEPSENTSIINALTKRFKANEDPEQKFIPQNNE